MQQMSPQDEHPISPFHKQPMFEKPLTPSDVGKLNRLVIPKQFAEKYFPIGGGTDPAGTLLAFEDEAGKCWRFRYSYWNSSQSYVLTKGWSRYVKDKSLDAGDVVVFERHRENADRFFIAWRRRGASCYSAPIGARMAQDSLGVGSSYHDRRLRLAEEEETNRQVNNNSPRLVRLFGVNFECEQLSNSQSTPATTSSRPSSSSSSSSYQNQNQQQQQQQQEAYYRNYFNHMAHLPPNHYHHMEMEFTQGGAMKQQMGSHLGL